MEPTAAESELCTAELIRHYPLAPDDPDAGKMEVHMDFSAKGMAACLYQTQRVNGEARLQFIDAAGRKTLAYERNYHSSILRSTDGSTCSDPSRSWC